MDATTLTEAFNRIGARVRIRTGSELLGWERARRLSIDVVLAVKGERFDVAIADPNVDFIVQDVRPKDRHLLLAVSNPAPRPGLPRMWDRFLCGHDERHWFVAAVPGSATTVRGAREALKPTVVRESENRAGINAKNRDRRRNAAFVRQGEWFFVPAPDLMPDERLILRDQPIQRSRGKPHMVEFLYRQTGIVRVSSEYPNGLTASQFEKLLRRHPEKRDLSWSTDSRERAVFAKGRVRHPDHKTIELPGWHRVLMSNEYRSPDVAFLD